MEFHDLTLKRWWPLAGAYQCMSLSSQIVSDPRALSAALYAAQLAVLWRPCFVQQSPEATPLHQAQEHKGSAGRFLLANLPLLHRREAGVQKTGKDGPADLSGFAEVFDLLRLQRLDRRQADLVEFARRDPIHHARLLQALGRVMHGGKESRFRSYP